jgi:hypothetical protein
MKAGKVNSCRAIISTQARLNAMLSEEEDEWVQ